jgi:splicing factor 3B subunit 3
VYHVVGVDVGFENPMFASLEVDYEDADNDPTGEVAAKLQQTLTFYELDLGLNHVVRKYSEPLDEHANLLISVPGMRPILSTKINLILGEKISDEIRPTTVVNLN